MSGEFTDESDEQQVPAEQQGAEQAPEQSGSEGEPSIQDQIAQLQAAFEERIPAPDQSQQSQPPLAQQFAQQPEPQQQGFDPNQLSDADYEQILREAGYLEEPEQQAQRDPMEERVAQLESDRERQVDEQRRSELNALADKYPDIQNPEILNPLKQRVEDFQSRYGPEVANDPKLVEQMYRSIKFDALKENEQPAELAAKQGAHLETGAGPSEQGVPDAKDDYMKALRSAGEGQGDWF